MMTLFIKKFLALGTFLTLTLIIAGCDKTDSTTATPPNSGTGLTSAREGADTTSPDRFGYTKPSPGGPPGPGANSGMGLTTGDAAQSGGQGSGLSGFNHTGEAGTSGAITQRME